MVGRVLDHYEIVQQLGRGGMGIVYKARDKHLDRVVALKVLPADKVADSVRKQRFVQEAKSASALHHPNIVVIYDIATSDGTDYIAMEYVAGQDLQQMLTGKPLRFRDALNIAVQIADALAAAHRAGIIHRDLKPANVMVDESGLVKLVDFGLAKLVEPVSELSETRSVSEQLTEQGAVIGTAAYMSPEQIEGKRLDARSDIFSFGLILYEMLSGKRAFQGSGTADTFAAILRDNPPPIREVVQAAPPELERVVSRCLKKDPDRRFQHIDDVQVALQEVRDELESGVITENAAVKHIPPNRVRWLASALVLVTAVVGLGGLLWSFLPARASRFTSEGPLLSRLTSESGLAAEPRLSPDGKLIAYASDRTGDGNLDIWLQQLAGGEPIRLTTDPTDDEDPAFSPDGSRILFSSGREGGGIYTVSALGGAAHKIAQGGVRPRFSADGKWVAYQTGDRRAALAGNGAVYIIPSNGGVPRRVGEDLTIAVSPLWSPNSESILVFGVQGRIMSDHGLTAVDWFIVDLASGKSRSTGVVAELHSRNLTPAEYSIATQHLMPLATDWTEDHILFSAHQGQVSNIWRIPFSFVRGRTTGAPERLTGGTAIESDGSVLGSKPPMLLAFSSLSENVDLWSLPILSNEGRSTGELQRLTTSLGADVRPSITPDGRRMVYNSNASGNWDIWFRDLQTGAESPLVSSEANEEHPRISSSGDEVIYRINHDVFIVPAVGGLARKLTANCATTMPWMMHGRSFVCLEGPGSSLFDVDSGKSKLLVDGINLAARLSWDDKWLIFYRNLSNGQTKIFVSPVLPDRPARDADLIAVTTGQTWDALPEFSPDGNLVYFESERDGSRCLWAQRLDDATKHPVGDPFAVQHFHRAGLSLMHVVPGQRALTVAKDKIILTAVERKGNVWLARFDAH